MDEKTGGFIEGVQELKQRLQRCMKTRRRTLPLRRSFGSNLPLRIDANITPELEMDIYADVADLIAHPPNGFTDEIELVRVWLDKGDNEVSITLQVKLLFDGRVEDISGLGL